MGRPRTSIEALVDKRAVRERLKDKRLKGWERQRLQVVQLAMDINRPLAEIAVEVGVHPRTVSTWLDMLREGGMAGLMERKAKGTGPASWLNKEAEEDFKEQLKEGKWRRAEDGRQWLQEKLGRPLKLVTVYKYLGKCEARQKVPRPAHSRQKAQAVETFRKTLCEQLHKKSIPLETSVHIWVMDEMRFGLQPVTRRMWTLKGVEIIAPVNPRYQWGYTYGALEVCGGSAEFMHTDGVSQEATSVFYQQLAANDAQAMHIIIADGAGFHLPEGHEKLPDNVRVVTLPPYSPELNPVEKLWDIVKDRICNRVWPELESLEEAITQVLKEYWSTPALVRSLVGQGVLNTEVNTSSSNVLVV